MKQQRKIFVIFGILCTLVLTGCGGGGSGSTSGSTNAGGSSSDIRGIGVVSLDSENGGVANRATSVSLTPMVVLKFSTAVNPTTVNSNTVFISTVPDIQQKIEEKSVAINNITANNDNTRFYFSPSSQIEAGTKYYIIVNGVKTTDGGPIVSALFNFTTGDSAIPVVSMISPGNNALGISTGTSIQLKFSKAVNNINEANITLHEGSATGEVIAISAITAGPNDTYVFSPIQALNQHTPYYVVLGTRITDMAGNFLAATSFNFTTGDFTAPTVNILSPGNNATGISVSPNIQLKFSKAVNNINEANITLHEGSTTGTVIPIGGITAGSNNIFTFSPVTALNQQTTYYIVLGAGITDVVGNPLTAVNFSFTTGDFKAPTVSLISPSNNATNITISPSIQVQFSEAVTNVNTANVILHAGSATGPVIALSSITAGSNNTFIFNPASALSGQVTYYITLGAGITDMVGNLLSATTFSFATVGTHATCWGRNQYHQIEIPTFPPLVNPSSIYAAETGSCTVDGSGLRCWGDYMDQSTVPITLGKPINVSVARVHSCAIGSNGVLQCWGNNSYGQTTVPPLVNPIMVSAGYDHTCALDSNGLKCWGKNNIGQTTLPTNPPLVNPIMVSAGNENTCVIDKKPSGNKVSCWGFNNYGQNTVPNDLVNPIMVSAGYENTCVIDQTASGNRVRCWGNIAFNARDVPPLDNPTVVSAGHSFICAIDNTGGHCWGKNDYNQTVIPIDPPLKNPFSISAGAQHACVVSED
jgi:hypothetical protein